MNKMQQQQIDKDLIENAFVYLGRDIGGDISVKGMPLAIFCNDAAKNFLDYMEIRNFFGYIPEHMECLDHEIHERSQKAIELGIDPDDFLIPTFCLVWSDQQQKLFSTVISKEMLYSQIIDETTNG